MKKIVELCDNHVENLVDNHPCESCPVRLDPNKYITVNIFHTLFKIWSITFIIFFLVSYLFNFSIHDTQTTCDRCQTHNQILGE